MCRQNFIVIGITLFLALFILNSNVFAISQESEQLLKLLEKKNIITDQESADMRQEMESCSQAGDKEAHETIVEGLLGKWADKIHPSACIEVEAFYEEYNFHDPSVRDLYESDLVLATVEIGFDVDIAKHVKGSLYFLYEEDDTEPMDVDEGIITIDGADVVPLYVDLGKMYIPFGRFESHFIRDPLTLEVGETNESAVVGGFRNDLLEISVGAFNGDIDETGEGSNHINNYLASACFALPETTVQDLNLTAGISWISNIADSDVLQEEIEDAAEEEDEEATIKNHANGFNAFIIASFRDKYFFNAEYLGAMDDIEMDTIGESYKPQAWTIEFAYGLTDRLKFGVCYEGTDDCDDFLPKKQFGGVVGYDLFKHTYVALEYLYGKFENKDTRHLMTTQLAIEF